MTTHNVQPKSTEHKLSRKQRVVNVEKEKTNERNKHTERSKKPVSAPDGKGRNWEIKTSA